jgi:hypothetical protein
MAFVQRLIDVTFTLGQGSFAESGTNTVKLSGLRISSRCVKAGGPSMGTMQMQIYGMTLSLMNKLSTLGMMIQLIPRNVVTVEAGDAISGMGTVFIGTITNAWADFQSAPDVAFFLEAHTGLIEAVGLVPPSSYKGAASVPVIMSSLATLMGLAFENNGVTAVLANPYLSGSARSQVKACAEAAGINWVIDNGILAIWPKNGARGGEIPLISPDTGLVGYPAYTAQGLSLKTIFNPSVGFGSKIEVKSDLTPACGIWSVYSLNHDLDSQVPRGSWFSTIGAYNPNFAPPVIQ